ncbi:MAG: hypothetical protein LBT29_01250 [Flavobacteriaceae bacterium]|nr:hypothetical protein [Flavobacteriaceae bacterium]
MKNRTLKDIIIKYLLETQLWVSLMISCLCLFMGFLHKHVDYERIALVFFVVLAGYNFIHYHRFWIKNFRHKDKFFVFIISLIATGYWIFHIQSFELLFLLSALCGCVLLYNSYLFPLKLRNVSVLKIFIIALVWTIFILYISNNLYFSTIEFFTVFLFIFAITLPFDIADMSKDSVSTIPKMIGEKRSKLLAYICLLTSTGLFASQFSDDKIFLSSWTTACLISMTFTNFTQTEHSYFHTRFAVEACSALPLFCYGILKYFFSQI